MSFWEKAKNIANATVNAMDAQFEKQAKRMSDRQLLEALDKYPNNKYFITEAEKRRLI